MPNHWWILETQDDTGRWSRHDGAPTPNPVAYDGPPQQAANHLREVFVRTLASPAPGPRAIRIRLWEGHRPDGAPQAETEWSRE
ncbi:hypothetical protein OG455_02220 [Kitasatospora sp. NBC_01287]|uniref:hypothetical protein n=1 Tax=Kitasatospora sp. NBC_01287 TaxID=2903573 RepID=UPI002251E703|nr:hypothetical protein [Kitasatospora sp. NBC_01287]MCX4744340.1 hypothetical protein [Kitasatospora sp. NBC_01287]